jgi:hypothetical protein
MFNITYIKKSSRGWPSSDSKNEGFAKAVKSCIKRAEELMLRFLRYGAALDNAMTKAGYSEFREPEVVAIIAYTAYVTEVSSRRWFYG